MKTELSSLAPASFETEMLVVFAVNKADKKDKKADPQIELLTPDTEVTSAAAKAVSGREFAGGSCETLLLRQSLNLVFVDVDLGDDEGVWRCGGACPTFPANWINWSARICVKCSRRSISTARCPWPWPLI